MAVYILKSQFVIYFCLCTASEEDIISEIAERLLKPGEKP